jgi:hypothetical protein
LCTAEFTRINYGDEIDTEYEYDNNCNMFHDFKKDLLIC